MAYGGPRNILVRKLPHPKHIGRCRWMFAYICFTYMHEHFHLILVHEFIYIIIFFYNYIYNYISIYSYIMCTFLCEGLRLCLRCCGIWPELTDTNIYDICLSQICTCWSQHKIHMLRACKSITKHLRSENLSGPFRLGIPLRLAIIWWSFPLT